MFVVCFLIFHSNILNMIKKRTVQYMHSISIKETTCRVKLIIAATFDSFNLTSSEHHQYNYTPRNVVIGPMYSGYLLIISEDINFSIRRYPTIFNSTHTI